mgnify:FL=1
MFEFLKVQYRLGKIGEKELDVAVARGWITEEQKEAIRGNKQLPQGE